MAVKEDDVYEHAYIFIIRLCDWEGEPNYYIDSWLDVSKWQLKKLLDAANNNHDEENKIGQEISMMRLRRNYNSEMSGPYLIHSHEALTVLEIEKFIQNNKDIKKWLKQAEFR